MQDLDETIVVVTGGRNFANKLFLNETLDMYFPEDERPVALIHGDCTGADALAKEWAIEHGVPQIPVGAPWDAFSAAVDSLAQRHGVQLTPEFIEAFKKLAGPLRNEMLKRMLVGSNVKRKVVVGFPGGRGTADCMRRARSAADKIAVIEVK